ncbi:MAG: hypothetical protein QG635_1748, partial [Bacteroidota bacterium]|nr:hypothetical protein [Bacteroidota bacterium]
MKKNTLISLISIAFIVVLFLSCDEIGLPYTKEKKVGPVQTGDTLQKVLIEDYTGAQCGFCPRAAEIAHTIAEANPGRVIIISVHSGNFAKPSGKYTYDFRTTAGDEFDKFFGNSKAGNPNGLVNRT